MRGCAPCKACGGESELKAQNRANAATRVSTLGDSDSSVDRKGKGGGAGGYAPVRADNGLGGVNEVVRDTSGNSKCEQDGQVRQSLLGDSGTDQYDHIVGGGTTTPSLTDAYSSCGQDIPLEVTKLG